MVFGPGSKDHKSINSILPEGLLSNLEYSVPVMPVHIPGKLDLLANTAKDPGNNARWGSACNHFGRVGG